MEKLKDNLYRHVEFLSTLTPVRNYLNKESIDKTVNYISDQLNSFGYEVEWQEFETSKTDYIQCNVCALYGNPSKPRLVVGAHYDVCGDTPGADDNASALAGMLETARLLNIEKPELDYCIEFVAYANEEPPFFRTKEMGSYIHAKSLYDEEIDVIGMICYEMIGYYSDEPNSQQRPFELEGLKNWLKLIPVISKTPNSLLKPILEKAGVPLEYMEVIIENKEYLMDIKKGLDVPDTGNFAIVQGRVKQLDFTSKVYNAVNAAAEMDVRHTPLPQGIGLDEMSDHLSYWKFGYNAVMINDTSHLRNPHYHQLSDTIETLDFDKMAEVVKGVYAATKIF